MKKARPSALEKKHAEDAPGGAFRQALFQCETVALAGDVWPFLFMGSLVRQGSKLSAAGLRTVWRAIRWQVFLIPFAPRWKAECSAVPPGSVSGMEMVAGLSVENMGTSIPCSGRGGATPSIRTIRRTRPQSHSGPGNGSSWNFEWFKFSVASRFFGDYSGTTSGIPRMQGARRATGPAPLREGGGAAMNGKRMHGKRQAAGAATGGVLRSAVAASATSHRNKRINHSADGACESLHRRPPAVLPPPPFPSAPHSQSTSHLSPGDTPLSEGGECSRTLHAPNTSSRSRPSSPSTIIPEEPASQTVSTHKVARKRDPPERSPGGGSR